MMEIFFRGRITIYDSTGFLVLYLFYIAVVIVGRIINKRNRRNNQQNDTTPFAESLEDDDPDAVGRVESGSDDERGNDRPLESPQNDSVARIDQVDGIDLSDLSGSSNASDTSDTTSLSAQENIDVIEPSFVPMLQFLDKLNPFSGFVEKKWYWKIWAIINAPVIVIFNLTIPIVNEELDENGWCQYLVVVQSVMGTQIVSFFTGLSSLKITIDDQHIYYGWQVAILVGLLMAIFILCTSVPNIEPCYFSSGFSILGFITSVVWMYVLANEVVSLLKAFGVVLGLSDVILGLTVLAWGNSIGDFISDTSVARSGYPRMGFSACFGGQLLNLLLGCGIPFTIQFLSNGGKEIPIKFDAMSITLCASLGVSLLTSLIMMPASKFHASKIQGGILMGLYLILVTTAVIVEFTAG